LIGSKLDHRAEIPDTVVGDAKQGECASNDQPAMKIVKQKQQQQQQIREIAECETNPKKKN